MTDEPQEGGKTERLAVRAQDWVARGGLLVLGFICVAQRLGIDLHGLGAHVWP